MTKAPAHAERIWLIGYMGAGKSTIGRMVAKRIGYRFLDTDHVLKRRFNKSITDIFEDEGEAFFREEERKLLIELLDDEPRTLISTGGGTVCRPETFNLIYPDGGVLIYLHADVSLLYERVLFSHKDRPMLDVPDSEQAFQERFKAREQFYNQAHFTVSTQEKDKGVVVRKIVDYLKPYLPPKPSGAVNG